MISRVKQDYIILIKGSWVFGRLETENRYLPGNRVVVRPTATNKELILTDN